MSAHMSTSQQVSSEYDDKNRKSHVETPEVIVTQQLQVSCLWWLLLCVEYSTNDCNVYSLGSFCSLSLNYEVYNCTKL